MLIKRIRPWIVGCVEIEELCRSIDIFQQYTGNNKTEVKILKLSVDEFDDEDPEKATTDTEVGRNSNVVRFVESFSSKKLFQDMQERLLVMSHYRLQQTLDTAPVLT